jgi:hypothetical protein
MHTGNHGHGLKWAALHAINPRYTMAFPSAPNAEKTLLIIYMLHLAHVLQTAAMGSLLLCALKELLRCGNFVSISSRYIVRDGAWGEMDALESSNKNGTERNVQITLTT